MSLDLTDFLSGDNLYGDNFTGEEIEKWFADEAEGYRFGIQI